MLKNKKKSFKNINDCKVLAAPKMLLCYNKPIVGSGSLVKSGSGSRRVFGIAYSLKRVIKRAASKTIRVKNASLSLPFLP